jgi:nucleoside-diphosphate-sugar epimerase
MTTALIGYTGFVGGNLAQQAHFDDLYRSTNIQTIAGKRYDLIVSAGVSSLKWEANRDPEADRLAINRLIDALNLVETRQFILISTVDVYDTPREVDENSPVRPENMMPYGRNRWELELYVRQRFNALIIRLPNLFGERLKKNIIYDLLHDNAVNQIHQGAVLQWYCLDNLWADIRRVIQHDLRLVNFAVEPWLTLDLVREVFGSTLPDQQVCPPPAYDVRTRYAALWGKAGPYLYRKDEVLGRLRRFVTREQTKSVRV